MKELRGKNAILTGASYGIGPYIAQALAAEGVNLVLAARSTEQLSVVAREIAHMGVHAIPIPTDLTDESSRLALIDQANAELGGIDILVNSAGTDDTVRFVRQCPENMRRLFELNLAAPLFLTRLMLPFMIERAQGHIVTISSLGGKKGVPYEATYCATKAGLIEWTAALRLELEGTGVGASVICPIYVADAGMFSRHGYAPPRLAGSVLGSDVARAVVRAIRRDIGELLVRPSPTRPLLVLNALSPALGNLIIKLMGIVDLHRRIADKNEAVRDGESDKGIISPEDGPQVGPLPGHESKSI